MDFKDPKNRTLFLIIIIFLVLIYIWYAKFYTPYAARIDQRKARYEMLLSNLHAVRQKAQSLDVLQKEYDELEKKFNKYKLLLPEQKKDEDFLSQLHIAAQLTGSAVTSVTPLEPVIKDFYAANNYQVELSSTYNGLGNFFARVANFPFVVTVSNVQLKTSSPTVGLAGAKSRRRKDHTVLATFKLTTYNVHQGGQAQ